MYLKSIFENIFKGLSFIEGLCYDVENSQLPTSSHGWRESGV